MYFVFKNSTFQQKNGASDSVLNIKSSRLWLRNIYSCPCIFSAVFLCCVLFYFVCIKIYSQVRTYLKKKIQEDHLILKPGQGHLIFLCAHCDRAPPHIHFIKKVIFVLGSDISCLPCCFKWQVSIMLFSQTLF